MKRTKVQIERETKKAYLVFDGTGRKGWIQKRWLGGDNTVAEKTMAKADEKYKEHQAAYAEAKEWSNEYHRIISVEKETEKAVAVKAVFDAYNLERDFDQFIWIPKSLIKDMAVQGWFVAKKIREVSEELTERIRTGVLCEYVAVADCERLFY